MPPERRPLVDDEIARIEELRRLRESGTYYALLGIEPDVAPEDIEAAYHDIVRKWHPDRFYSRDTGEYATVIEENFVAATRAFRTLRDATKRQTYHREANIDTKPARPAPNVTPSPPSNPPPERPSQPVAPTRVSVSRTTGGTPLYELGLRPRPVPPPPPKPPPAPPPKPPAAVEKLRQQISAQLAKAQAYYEAGKEDLRAGRYAKAENALYLALKFDPKNAEYEALHKEASQQARDLRVKGLVQQAEQEESYGRVKEAIALYQKAVESEPPDGVAYFRLGKMQRSDDSRSAVANLRKAVAKEPKNPTYRLVLAELYVTLNLHANALREVQAALEADPKNADAKAMLAKVKK